MSSTQVETPITVEGHPTESLQAFLRSLYGIDSRDALADLCAPGGMGRNYAMIASIELNRPHPPEDFTLQIGDAGRRITERDVLNAAAAFYQQARGATSATVACTGSLICSFADETYIGVVATGGGPEMWVTVHKH